MPTRFLAAGAALVVLIAAMALNGPSGNASTGLTERVSVTTSGQQGDGLSGYPSVSGDGRYVAFSSDATNLAPGDTNLATDIFVRDRLSGVTEWVSVSVTGGAGDGTSYVPAISADGRYVAFASSASNLVAGDANGVTDVFVRDRVAGTTALVSVDGAGNQGNNPSYESSLSADGRFVAFRSASDNLVPGDTNKADDVFVRDRLAGTTTRVSLANDGSQSNRNNYAPGISSDGRFVVFWSSASNLVAGDTNHKDDVFVRDTLAGTTVRASVSSAGAEADGRSNDAAISGDGRFVTFRSHASNLVAGDTNTTGDVFVNDLSTGATELVSASGGVSGDGISGYPDINHDGSLVVFRSAASNLVSGDTNGAVDVFVRDRIAGVTSLASVDSTGVQGDRASDHPSISSDGGVVAFHSWARNLVPGDTNRATDTFAHQVAAAPTPSPTPTDTPAPSASPTPSPTPTPVWIVTVRGDVNCSGGATPVDAVDALQVLRYVAGFPVIQYEPCDDVLTGGPPLQGDIDCDGDADAVDALRILRFVAGLDPNLPPGCPPIGITITQATPAPTP
ncbi:MAG TPA: calcium-binding protein [Dehalococcoidia bacterium]|nr:calcium-binding protein [Dehalococcoidia bacterium]